MKKFPETIRSYFKGGYQMSRNTKKIGLGITAIVLIFAVYYVIALDRQPSSEAALEELTETLVKTPENPQARDLVDQLSEAFESASGMVSPAVVSIFAEQVVEVQNPFGMPDDAFRDFFGGDFFRRFFGTPQPQEEKKTVRSLGSGVIVTKDGYILTNNHVVEKADKLSVVVGDKKTYDAKVIGTDPPTDVAVIKIDSSDLPVASLGDSDDVKIGQWVIAVGNPFQLMHTVTAGIISAKGRSSVGLADYEDFIQTDASINPGNSGGALADLDGNVIGINTAITSPSGGNIGIGFAIPINMARQVMSTLMSQGKVSRGYLAIYPQDINANLAKALKLESLEGSLVADVTPGGPADRAGMKRGDVIVGFNGQEVTDTMALRNMVAQVSPGKTVAVQVIRDGRKLGLKVRLEERPGGPESESPEQEHRGGQMSMKLGIGIQTLMPDLAEQLGFKNQKGAIITEVVPGSPADEAGLERGDLIQEANQKTIRSAEDFEKQVRGLKSGDVVALLIRRGVNTFFVAVQMQ
jgi:serine protease Do